MTENLPDLSTDCPTVSVLMTVYNGMPYLPAAVESIFSQTLQDFEFVIVDDGSEDSTPEYLASLNDPRLRLVRQENQGTAAAANHGLEYCRGEFIARLDADDIAFPERLERQVEFMRAHPDVGILGTQVVQIGDRRVGKNIVLPTEHDEVFSKLMKGEHGLAHSSCLLRTEVLKSIGGYWKKPLLDDWDMKLRMGEVSRMANLDEVLLKYRVHETSINGVAMLKIFRHVGYAIDCAKRRQSQRELISYETYLEEVGRRPIWVKLVERSHIYAMQQYRIAVAEILGSRPGWGRLRLAWSALFFPSRAIQRIRRVLMRRFGRNRRLAGSS